jgi:hypothetical protein
VPAGSRRSYSCRSATIGSTRTARRTGTYEASSATAIIAPPPIASGNALSHFKSERRLVASGLLQMTIDAPAVNLAHTISRGGRTRSGFGWPLGATTGDPRENMTVAAQVFMLIPRPITWPMKFGRGIPDQLHELFGMLHRDLAQHHGVKQAVDGSVGADPECKREDSHGCEGGAAPHQPQGIADVVREHSH